MENLAKELQKRVDYAKTSILPIRALYEVYGQIKMARELNAITKDEFFDLNHSCVYDGINNPKYFR
jgi:hypothetical protein